MVPAYGRASAPERPYVAGAKARARPPNFGSNGNLIVNGNDPRS